MKFNLFTFSFINFTFGDTFKNLCQNHKDFLMWLFFSRAFVVLGFMLDLWSLYELISVCNVRYKPKCMFCSCIYLIITMSLESVILHWITFTLFSKISYLYMCGSISWLPILFPWSICLPLCQYQTVLTIVAFLMSWSQLMLSYQLSSFSKLLCVF